MSYTPFTGFSYATGLAALGQGLGRINQSIEEAENRKLLASAFSGNPQAAALAMAGQPSAALALTQQQDATKRSSEAAQTYERMMGGGVSAPQTGSGAVGDPLDLIMKHESAGKNVNQNVVPAGGGYNPSVGRVTGPSSASGYFQMIDPTWRKAATMAGIDTGQYPRAISAPYELQRKAAEALFKAEGFAPWAPYNAALRKDIAAAGGPGAFRLADAGGGVAPGPAAAPAARVQLASTGGLPVGGGRPSTTAPSPDGFPTDAEIQQMVSDGVLPQQIDAGFLRQAYANEPVLRQNIEKWRATRGGPPPQAAQAQPAPTPAYGMNPGAPPLPPARPAGLGAPPAAATEDEVQRAEIASGMVNPDGSLPAAAPGLAPAPGPAQPADAVQGVPLPYRNAPAAPADTPAPGATAAQGFVVPGAPVPTTFIPPQPTDEMRHLQRQARAAQAAALSAPPSERGAWTQIAQQAETNYRTARAEQVRQAHTEWQAARQDAVAERRQREVLDAEERRERQRIAAEERKAKADADRQEKMGPTDLTREFVWARQNGMTQAKTPAEYAKEKGAADKAPTEGQANANIYARRMEEAEQVLGAPEVQKAAVDPVARGASRIPGIGNFLVSSDFQRADQAQRDFINASLRRESGAAISESEFENARRQYFPQPGDGPAVLAQKARNRATQIEGIRAAAGPAYTRQAPAQREVPAIAAPPAAAPARQAPATSTAIPEGATATNPQTGQRIRFIGGRWVPEA